jgi:hypothetical protein
MRTDVLKQPGQYNGRVIGVIVRELDDDQAHRITAALGEQGIRVEPIVDVYHVLHLWALAPTSTAQEVTALAAFSAETDCRLAWHEAAS